MLILLTREAIHAMLKWGGGAIVNASSAQGRANQKGVSVFGTGNAATNGPARAMPVDLAAEGSWVAAV